MPTIATRNYRALLASMQAMNTCVVQRQHDKNKQLAIPIPPTCEPFYQINSFDISIFKRAISLTIEHAIDRLRIELGIFMRTYR